jgi:hypothetical protein
MYPLDWADTAAAFRAGMAVAAERQTPMRDPMGGAVAYQAESSQMPFDYEDRGESPESGPVLYGGVT